ncbi:outer membrane protein, borrelia PFam52 protein (plasmid) [Borreliella bissettiae DN127]|uniref:Outer membrane protein, borrelia PFam52 protein n=1 Tax=Borrelia bissettiae (strain DSM 17990 / CIP 109136 / DN127) TaxID=521010 RepID=G0AP85_BORBD|nr:P52 family lipoprotein [Borreliella bissettiae]AEL19511.1 outer membrane protein, borrelia PFam52 protein [Borreliella bissettiae DN127]
MKAFFRMYIIILALILLGCYLPDKQEQAVKTFFDNFNDLEDCGMRADDIITEGKFSNLKLYASEHRLLDDIEKTLYNLKYGSYPEIPPLPDYNEEYFDKFFLDLGSERSRELIRLFGRVKNDHNNKFKSEVYFLYSCIRELYSSDIKYSGEDSYEYIVFMPRPTIDQQYFKLKKEIERVF